MDRDRFMSAEEAKEYGLIDNVISHRGKDLVADKRRPTVTERTGHDLIAHRVAAAWQL